MNCEYYYTYYNNTYKNDYYNYEFDICDIIYRDSIKYDYDLKLCRRGFL